MINEIRLENVRVFEGEGWRFPLHPLTMLCGTNSAGKSTILKSLLLLKHNIATRPEPSFGIAKLRFRISDIDLGSYKSFVSHNDVTRPLSIGFSFNNVLSSRSVTELAKVAPAISTDSKGRYQALRYTMHCDFRFLSRQVALPERENQIEKAEGVVSVAAGISNNDGFLAGADFKLETAQHGVVLTFQLRFSYDRTEEEGKYLLVMPKEITEDLESPLEDVVYAHPEEKTLSVPVSTRGFLPDRVMIFSQMPDGKRELRYTSAPVIFEESLADLRRALTTVSYIGPLRAAAERYYLGDPDVNIANDATGKSLPHFLSTSLQSPVTFAAPVTFEKLEMSLDDSLDYWLRYLRTGAIDSSAVIRKEINVGSTQDIFVEVKLRSQNGEESHALADSGFGYSQLLPILVRGLLLAPGSMIAIEQPEVHLNPALQARLTEFLISIANSLGQVFVETHSEHIVDYLRARTAEDRQLATSKKVMILYLDTESNRPKIRNLCIAEDGSIPEWPENFFGESRRLTARILRAQRIQRVERGAH